MARSTKKHHSKASFIIMVIGFAIGLLIGRGLEWGDEDDDEENAQ